MYEPDDDYMGGGGGLDPEESEEIPNEIWQEACWIVISAYFEEKGDCRLWSNSDLSSLFTLIQAL